MELGPTLHQAAKENNSHLAFDLLRKSVPKNGLNGENQTPLHVACLNGSFDVVKLLIEYRADLFIADFNGNSPAMIAKNQKNKELVRLLVEQGAPCPPGVSLALLGLPADLSPLHFAVKARNKESLRSLISIIAKACGDDLDKFYESLNPRDKYGLTPLHLAAQLGDPDCVFELVSEEINPDLQDSYGRTALQLAITCEHNSCALTLIKWSKNLDLQDKWQNTALYYALTFRNQHLTEALVLAGAATDRYLDLAHEMGCLDLVHKAIKEREEKARQLQLLQADNQDHQNVSLLEEDVKPITRQFESITLRSKSPEAVESSVVMDVDEEGVLKQEPRLELPSELSTSEISNPELEHSSDLIPQVPIVGEKLSPPPINTGIASSSTQNKNKKKANRRGK